jgi:hypothetical protein
MELLEFLYALSLVWNVSDVNKAKGLDCNHCRNKNRIAIARQLPSYQAVKNSVFSVLREARSNDRTFVT